jgi:hypothetical protein
LHLDETLVCVFLYGVFGEGAEEHLRPLLREARLSRRALEILIWLGSPAAVPEVKAAYGASRDYETFIRMTAFMMKAGGPEGRAAMLELRPADLDAKSRDYLAKVKPAIVSASYESLRKQFRATGASAKLSDDEVKARLAAMNARHGKDETTSPGSILDATLPGELLIGELVKIRARTFHRLSDEALSDVEMTNALINTLRYRAR